jgi:multisubunit Na+/H+ antiporter MnhG subunit
LKLIAVWLLVLLASATASQIIARAAHQRDARDARDGRAGPARRGRGQ